MKVEIYKTRTVFTSRDKVGTMNENYIEVLEFTFPEELDGYVKYIEIEAENDKGTLKYVDRIEDNKFALSNGLTKYDNLQMQVVCKKYVENKAVTVFKSNIFTVGVDSSLNIMEDVEEEQKSLLDRIEAELQEVYQGMEEFKTEIVEDANSRFNTNVREKTETFNENAETKTNAFNTNYDEKLGTFNTNATSKLDQYNNNDTAKTGAYNANAIEKLSTYNQNATTKTSEYNTNAQTKLEAYNTNAQSKKEDFDTNAEEKLQEYNDNASALMQSVETLEQKHDTEVAELNEKIADLQEEVDMASDLIPIEDESGSDFTLNNSARYYFKKFEVEGKSKQTTYTGKNKLNVPENLTFTRAYSILETPIPAGTYKLTFDSESHGGNNYPAIRFTDNSITENLGTVKERTITLSSEETRIYFYSNGADYSASAGIEATITKLMVSTEGGDYEPYTGGQPAPNPSYECPIQNVSGNVEVKVENKNLAVGLLRGYYNPVTKNRINTDSTIMKSFKTKISAGTYTLSCNALINLVRAFTDYDNSTGLAIYHSGSTNKYEYTFTITEDTVVYLSFRQTDNTAWADTNLLQFEEGSATTYEPHEEQTVTFPLSEGQVLHEGDTIEDKIVQRRNILKLNGTENWVRFTGYSGEGFIYYMQILNMSKKSGKKAYCTHYIEESNVTEITTINKFTTNGGVGNVLWISTNLSLTEFKAFLAQQYANGTPVTVEYELETPIEIPFTEAQKTAKAQIDKLISYKGTTHITSNANLDVTYRKDPNLAEEQQNNKLEELEARLALLEG